MTAAATASRWAGEVGQREPRERGREGAGAGAGRLPTWLRGGWGQLSDPAGVKMRGKDWARVSGGGKRKKKTRPLSCCARARKTTCCFSFVFAPVLLSLFLPKFRPNVNGPLSNLHDTKTFGTNFIDYLHDPHQPKPLILPFAPSHPRRAFSTSKVHSWLNWGVVCTF